MEGNKMRFFALVIGILISVSYGFSQCPIIPAPVTFVTAAGQFFFGEDIAINSDNAPSGIIDYAANRFTNTFGIRVVISPSAKQLVFKKVANVPTDYYSINVGETIIITYSSDASCFYAVNSLFQLIQGNSDQYSIAKCFLKDYPKFSWRGLHLDVSRHFFTVDEVKRYIDLMAMYKFNKFHWHLTDDQGWRIEIKQYPKLIEIGAWRDSTVNAHYSTTPRTYAAERTGGFYTQEQIKEIVQYAANRYITVIPEIEMPGHARAALAAYPELSCTGKQHGVEGLWGVFDDIFCAHESSIQFLKNVLDEVMVLFPSEYIHIGGDEAPKTRWKKCAKCQAVIRENGLKDEHELQSWFVTQMDMYLTSKGRKLIGWDEILEGGLSPNATVMSWRGFEGGVDAAKQGHDVIMSPGSHCYFDHYQSKNSTEPLAIGGYTPIEKVYQFNPIPSSLTAAEATHVLGGQANLWTEYIPDMKQLEYMLYPRALALAQVLWCVEVPSYDLFRSVLIKHQLNYLDRFKVNYSRAMFYPEMKVSRKEDGLGVVFTAADTSDQLGLTVRLDQTNVAPKYPDFLIGNNTLQFKRGLDSVVTYRFEVKSEYMSTPSEFKMTIHPAIGLNVEYITPPDERYNSGGNLTLVDGIIGAKPWKGNEWVGFDDQEIELIVDLGKKSKIDRAELNFLEDIGSWIHLPNFVRISVSTNGKKWAFLPDKPIYKAQGGGTYLPFEFQIQKKARYVRFKIVTFDVIPDGMPGEGHVQWTFLDELMLFSK
jgi:hexosaminidase